MQMLSNVRVEFEKEVFASFTVARVELRAGLSELFELVVEIHSSDPAADFLDAVGGGTLVELQDEPFVGKVKGIASRVQQLTAEPSPGVSAYEITVVPPHWVLTRQSDNRIFRDKSAVEIVEKVLSSCGGGFPAPTKHLVETYPKRDYCVQYGETDHDFVMRLLADEGITSFFDFTNDAAWTLVDDTPNAAAAVSPSAVPFRPVSTHVHEPHVSRVVVGSSIARSAVRVRDWDYTKPRLMLSEDADPSPDKLFPNESALRGYTMEVGKFSDSGAGKKRANKMLEEARAERNSLTVTPSFVAHPGQKLSIEDHPRDGANGDFLVVRTRYSNRGANEKQLSLDCVPLKTRFRPARRPKPRIWGTQTALVVTSGDSEEIMVDDLGRVKLLFRWDERDSMDGDTTRWVRVSQGWAGPGFGFTMLPRRGDEVIVAYIDGDPDEPIIVGRVHNKAFVPPLKLPDDKTQSVWRSRSSPGGDGYNEIMMEDKAGSELIRIHAQKDYNHHTNHDSGMTVGHDDSRTITNDQALKVGNDQTTVVSNNQTITVSAASSTTCGNISTESKDFIKIKAATDIDMNAGVNIKMDAATLIQEHAGSAMKLSSGATLNADSDNITIKAGTMLVGHGGAVVGLSAGGTATLRSGGVVFVAADAGVNVTGGAQANMSAPMVVVKGSGEVQIIGGNVTVSGADVTVTGTGTVSVSSPTVNVTGGGATNVKGGIVKLNC